ncbi:hypothetical protein PSACC_00880 [Paramicrosporidium saccamoebae]|uniref:Uncharacterized protein n=1 Tax=Paramicrosporidium saccamoebae TaxID=1246581 RepID=A0A2H9TNT3_9FUNG|nr:hypothetical protein PSACC_00880 [Paramicrosporidium saccamoebae]
MSDSFDSPRPIPLGDSEAQKEFEMLQKQFSKVTEILSAQGETGFAREEADANIDKSGRNKVTGEVNGPKGWATAEHVSELNGPLVLIAMDDVPLVLCCDEGGLVTSKAASELQLSSEATQVEPNDTLQVFVGQSLIPGQYSLKSAFGKYLTSDSVGKVAGNRDAVGPSEEWVPMKVDGGFALQNIHGRYLSVDRESGKVRADSEVIGFAETFYIRCHASRKKKEGRLTITAPEEYDLDSVELEQA